ncbi:hypothetical protein LPJ56_006711 [Coemansia sp. RSA 2599]|nr:hypothetical protein LPJ75_006759 [Coemansia sp. RSA 2598]KAJ1804540.1 hypothetical protein LPJ56_006711 [Coemansia sp. RSA 2599]
MVESLSHTSPAPSQRLFGTVVSDTCGTRGERTIEVEVTSAQLQNILMMQKRTASPKRPAALAAQSIAPRSTKGKANGDSCCVARTAAAATATAHLRDCRRASTCATSSVAHGGEENHQSPEGALNTAAFLAIAAAAVLATSTTTALGLQHGSKDVVFLGQLQAAEISNVLNCSS